MIRHESDVDSQEELDDKEIFDEEYFELPEIRSQSTKKFEVELTLKLYPHISSREQHFKS